MVSHISRHIADFISSFVVVVVSSWYWWGLLVDVYFQKKVIGDNIHVRNVEIESNRCKNRETFISKSGIHKTQEHLIENYFSMIWLKHKLEKTITCVLSFMLDRPKYYMPRNINFISYQIKLKYLKIATLCHIFNCKNGKIGI